MELGCLEDLKGILLKGLKWHLLPEELDLVLLQWNYAKQLIMLPTL